MEIVSTVKRRQFRSKSEILELLKEQQQSGLSISAFCMDRSIAQGSFHNWKKRYSPKQSPVSNNGFAHVQLTTASVGLFAEVNGIKLYQPVSAGYLKELIL